MALAAATASAQPVVVSEEIELSAPVARESAGWDDAPAVASDGTDYLVVWRNGFSNDDDLLATRVGGDGGLIEPLALPIAVGDGDEALAGLAWGADAYFAVWTHPAGKRVARISRQGVAAAPIELFAEGAPEGIACGATECLVLLRRDASLHATRIRPDGVVLDPFGFEVADGAVDSPAVARSGDGYLVVWAQAGEVRGARVTPAAEVLDAIPFTIAALSGPAPAYTAITTDGAAFLAAWQDGGTIFGARVGGDGAVLDAPALALADEVSAPALVHDGVSWIMMFTTVSAELQIRATRVFADGMVVPSASPLSTATVNGSGDPRRERPEVAFNGTDVLVVWPARDPEDELALAIDAARAGADLTPRDDPPILVSTVVNATLFPAVAYGGGVYLVAWSGNEREWAGDVFASRVGRDGAVLDTPALVLSDPVEADFVPSVAFDGHDFVVVWSHGYARVTPSGEVLVRSVLFGVGAGQLVPACNGDGRCLASWRTVSNAGEAEGHLLVIDAEGPAEGPVVLPLGAADDPPRLAWDGVGFLAAWSDGDALRTARFAVDGTLETPAATVTTREGLGAVGGLACAEGRCVAVWAEGTPPTFITAVDVAAGAPGGEPIAVAAAMAESVRAGVLHDGTRFLVMWSEHVASLSRASAVYLDDGRMVFDLVPNARMLWSLGGASDGAGRTVAVYDRLDRSPGRGTLRAYARTIASTLPDGGIAEDSGGDGCGCRAGGRGTGGAAIVLLVALALAIPLSYTRNPRT